MGFLDRFFSKESKAPDRDKPDFSNVKSESSSTAPSPPDPPQESVVHTVQKGDTLSAIAQRYYGEASEWRRIYEANRDEIENPDLIHPGQEFQIPQPVKEEAE